MARRKAISLRIRFKIFERDRHTCQYCGAQAPDVRLEVDHIIPVARGGDNEVTNLVTACYECNRGKSAKSLSEEALNRIQLAADDEGPDGLTKGESFFMHTGVVDRLYTSPGFSKVDIRLVFYIVTYTFAKNTVAFNFKQSIAAREMGLNKSQISISFNRLKQAKVIIHIHNQPMLQEMGWQSAVGINTNVDSWELDKLKGGDGRVGGKHQKFG